MIKLLYILCGISAPLLALDYELIHYQPSLLPFTDFVRLGMQKQDHSIEVLDINDNDNEKYPSGLSALVGIELGINAFHTILDPYHKTGLYPEIISPIRTVYKKMGDRFDQGELLIQLEDSVTSGKYLEALSLVDKGEAELEATRELFKAKLASLFELRKAEYDLAAAYASLASDKKNFESSQIRAPYKGIVETVIIEEHEVPQAGKELIKILQDEILTAKLLIPARLLNEVSIGTPIYIAVENTEDVIEAKVSRIGGMIDPSSSTIKIEAEISNKAYKYRPGTSGIATFHYKPKALLQ